VSSLRFRVVRGRERREMAEAWGLADCGGAMVCSRPGRPGIPQRRCHTHPDSNRRAQSRLCHSSSRPVSRRHRNRCTRALHIARHWCIRCRCYRNHSFRHSRHHRRFFQYNWERRVQNTRLRSGRVDAELAEIRQGRSDQDSSPCPTPPQSHAQTPAASRHMHRLPRWRGAGSSNRRRGRRRCRST
jgi:hypothetical protein